MNRATRCATANRSAETVSDLLTNDDALLAAVIATLPEMPAEMRNKFRRGLEDQETDLNDASRRILAGLRKVDAS